MPFLPSKRLKIPVSPVQFWEAALYEKSSSSEKSGGLFFAQKWLVLDEFWMMPRSTILLD